MSDLDRLRLAYDCALQACAAFGWRVESLENLLSLQPRYHIPDDCYQYGADEPLGYPEREAVRCAGSCRILLSRVERRIECELREATRHE